MTATTFDASTPVSDDTRPLADRLPLGIWAALAFVLTFLAGHRWGIAALVWVAPVPWLVLATRLRGKRAWAGLFALSLVAHVAWMSKVVTAPMPWFLGVAFGVPVAMGTFVGLGLYRVVRDRGGALAALSFYVAFVVASDLIGARTSELGAWSTSANALVADVTLMQLVSLGGLSSIGLLIAGVSGTLAMAVTSRRPSRGLPIAVVVGACLVAAYGFGAWRLDAGRPEARSVRVAAVTTSVGLGEAGLPDDATLGAAVDELFERSAVAVEAGAELVVWNEAAAMLRAPAEAPTIARGRAFAREHGVELVLGYAVLVNEAPFSFRNEYAWIDRDGAIVETYAKHHPVPGEPSVRGEAPLVVHEQPWGRGAGALCYDYDFPAMALEHARLGADLVVVPSSDWRGIDPYHTEMARVRAIEGGFSVVRPVRWAASAAYDSLGRVRGWMPADDPSGVMVVSVPTERVPTLYSKVGDAPMAVVAGAFGLASVVGIRRRKSERGRRRG